MFRAITAMRVTKLAVHNLEVINQSLSKVRHLSSIVPSRNALGDHKGNCGCSICVGTHSRNCSCQFCKLTGYQRRSHHTLGRTHWQGCKCGECILNRWNCPCDICTGKRMVSTKTEARKTCLYDLHVEKQGKIVDFAGWLLPVQYKEAIAASHQHTRTAASLFDVGHMLQTRVSGKSAGKFLESLTTSDLKNLANGSASLTVFTNETGGILDDLIITKDDEDKFFVVSNAGRRTEDSQLLLEQLKLFKSQGKDVSLEFLDPLEQGLIALQGPTSHQALQKFTKINLNDLKFMQSVETEVFDSPIRISRCGYTGEDGFEISVPEKIAQRIVEELLTVEDVKLAGLGARDSLRLEAGLCLYGHDIDETTTPVEAGLAWLVAKRRRAEANFPGAERILSQIKSKPSKRRVGLIMGQGPPAREGVAILTAEGERVGQVTSGGPSPTLGYPVAMGYLPLDLTQPGNGTLVEVRGKTYKATVAKMPFVKTNYYTAK